MSHSANFLRITTANKYPWRLVQEADVRPGPIAQDSSCFILEATTAHALNSPLLSKEGEAVLEAEWQSWTLPPHRTHQGSAERWPPIICSLEHPWPQLPLVSPECPTHTRVARRARTQRPSLSFTKCLLNVKYKPDSADTRCPGINQSSFQP